MTTLTTTISQQEEIVTFIPEQEVTEQETIQVELTTTVQEEVFIGGAEEASIITILVAGRLMSPRGFNGLIMEKECLHTQICCLKEIKKNPGKVSFAIELMKATGYVNIVDMLLLPLYYAWEHYGFGTLEEVSFEDYLSKAYLRFLQSAKSITLQIVLILEKVTVEGGLSSEIHSIIESLIKTYSTIKK